MSGWKGKDEVADGVVALTLRQIADSPLPRGRRARTWT
jgi:hypothetical protein